MADVERCSDLEFMNYGYKGDFSCTRNGSARVSLDGVNIGEITFTIIDREPISYGLYPPMAMVCDEASDLFDVAFHHFKDNGRLKSTLNKKLTDDANQGFFIYISTIELRPPYDRSATEENVAIAATAIHKFMDSRAFCNLDSGVLVTLFMYIADGVDRPRNAYSKLLRKLDARQFAAAGFGVVKGKPTFRGPGMWYMYCEMDWGFHG